MHTTIKMVFARCSDPLGYAIPDINELIAEFNNNSPMFQDGNNLTTSLFNMMTTMFPDKFVAVLLWQEVNNHSSEYNSDFTITSKDLTFPSISQDHWVYDTHFSGTDGLRWKTKVTMSNYTADSVNPIYLNTDYIFPLLNVTWAAESQNTIFREQFRLSRALEARMEEIVLQFANVSGNRFARYIVALHPSLPHFHRSNGNVMRFSVGDLETLICGRRYSMLKLNEDCRTFPPTVMYVLPSRTTSRRHALVSSVISDQHNKPLAELAQAARTYDTSKLNSAQKSTGAGVLRKLNNCSLIVLFSIITTKLWRSKHKQPERTKLVS